MRIPFLSLLAVLFSFCASAEDDFQRKSVAGFYIYETTVNESLIPQQCQIELKFNLYNNTQVPGQRVYMSINGVLEDVLLSNNPVKFDLTPGKFVFKIWGGPGYEEIITDSIDLKSQTTSKAMVNIQSVMEPVMLYKPVIYFHTDEVVNVSVGVNPVGDFTFTYPDITKGWNGTVNTDGTIAMNGVNYPYLFWESNQQYSYRPSDNGFKVERNQVIPFLEKKCAELGFNRQETTDFITFWGPKLSESEATFIQFTIGESCSQFADMTISPAPAQVNRVYIQFTEWSSVMEPYLNDKTFNSVSKSGFTVLEWGGFHFSLPQSASNNY